MLKPDEVLEAMAEAGIDSKEKLLFILKGASKPVQRAVVQERISALTAAFEIQRQEYNTQLAALQAELNAI